MGRVSFHSSGHLVAGIDVHQSNADAFAWLRTCPAKTQFVGGREDLNWIKRPDRDRFYKIDCAKPTERMREWTHTTLPRRDYGICMKGMARQWAWRSTPAMKYVPTCYPS